MRAEGANAAGVAELAIGLVLALTSGASSLLRSLPEGRNVAASHRLRDQGTHPGIDRLWTDRDNWWPTWWAGDARDGLSIRAPMPSGRPLLVFHTCRVEQLLAASDIISLHCPPPVTVSR